MADDTLDPLKNQLIEYVQLQLGDQIVDVELDPSHYEAAYQRTLGVYRQRAQNAYEESYSFYSYNKMSTFTPCPKKSCR